MKIGIVNPYSTSRRGGVQQLVEDSLRVLKERGYDVKLITPKPKKRNAKVQYDNADVIFLGTSNEIKFTAPWYTTTDISNPVEKDKIIDLLEKEKFDILHIHEPWLPMLGTQVLQHSKSKNIGHFHAIWPQNPVNKSLEVVRTPYVKSILNKLDAVVASSVVSEANVSQIAPYCKVEIIPNSIDLNTYNPSKVAQSSLVDQRKTTFLYVGRLERRKGPGYLLKAYKQAFSKNDNVELIIVGEGPLRRSLESYAKTWKLPNVKFLGFVDEETKLQLMKSADVFVAPSLEGESFGIVLIEAMAMGTAIIAGNCDGYRSVMKGVSRIGLVEPKDLRKFSDQLQLFAQEMEVREIVSSWSLNYVKQYDHNVVIDQYENLYKKLIS